MLDRIVFRRGDTWRVRKDPGRRNLARVAGVMLMLPGLALLPLAVGAGGGVSVLGPALFLAGGGLALFGVARRCARIVDGQLVADDELGGGRCGPIAAVIVETGLVLRRAGRSRMPAQVWMLSAQVEDGVALLSTYTEAGIVDGAERLSAALGIPILDRGGLDGHEQRWSARDAGKRLADRLRDRTVAPLPAPPPCAGLTEERSPGGTRLVSQLRRRFRTTVEIDERALAVTFEGWVRQRRSVRTGDVERLRVSTVLDVWRRDHAAVPARRRVDIVHRGGRRLAVLYAPEVAARAAHLIEELTAAAQRGGSGPFR